MLLSKGLESYEANEANEHEGQARSVGGAWGTVLAQGFDGGAVSVLRLAGRGTSNGGDDGGGGARADERENGGEEVGPGVEAGLEADRDEEGTHDDGEEDVVRDVDMEDAEEIAGEADPRVNVDGEDKVSGAPSPDTATSQKGKQGTQPKATKEKQGARIICWEYPAPML